MQRVRVHFAKGGPLRYTGHLDLARTWARLLRRAGIPVAYSRGFNPQPKLNLAAALPLGITSTCEVVDIWLNDTALPDDLLPRMSQAAPPGLTIQSLEQVSLKAPTLQSELIAIEYRVRLEPTAELKERIERLLAAPSLPRSRRGRDYDLRPLMKGLWLEEAGLVMQLTARPGGTGRPDEVMLALGLEPWAAPIERTRLVFVSREPN